MANDKVAHTQCRFVMLLCLGAALLSGTGCTTVQHYAFRNPVYQPNANACFTVGPVTNVCGKVFDIDVKQRMAEALTKKLRKKDMLWAEKSENARKIEVSTEVVYYEKGNAFLRWLAPGLGSTYLIVHCRLRDSETIIGEADAKRVIYAGGGYSIGAWSYVFSDVASDLVGEFDGVFRNGR